MKIFFAVPALLLLATGLISHPACGQTGRTARITYERYETKWQIATSFTVLVRDGIAQTYYQREEKKHSIDDSEFPNLVITSKASEFTNDYDLGRQHFTEQRTFQGQPLVADWPNDFEWTLTDETKTIAGYKARKAFTESYERKEDFDKGKAYAWFTTDIPIAAGPWRYAGLPGLILEINYENGHERYLFKDIAYDVDEPLREIVPGLHVSRTEMLYPYDRDVVKRLKKALKQGK